MTLGVWEYFFSTDNWNTTFAPSTGILYTSTEWHIYGLYGIWSTLPVFVSTSTVVSVTHRRLISPTGNVILAAEPRF